MSGCTNQLQPPERPQVPRCFVNQAGVQDGLRPPDVAPTLKFDEQDIVSPLMPSESSTRLYMSPIFGLPRLLGIRISSGWLLYNASPLLSQHVCTLDTPPGVLQTLLQTG